MTAEEFEQKLRHYARMARSSADPEERVRFRALADRMLDDLRSQLADSRPAPTRH